MTDTIKKRGNRADRGVEVEKGHGRRPKCSSITVGEKDGEGETNRERLMRGEDGVVFQGLKWRDG